MFELIVACDQNYGIGFEGKLPWKCPEELELFKRITMDSILVMGRKTIETLPKLPRRTIICMSRAGKVNKDNNNAILARGFTHMSTLIGSVPTKVFIAGGGELYKEALLRNNVSTIHISMLKNSYECDTFFPTALLSDFIITDEVEYKDFTYRVLKKLEFNGEKGYLDLLKKVLQSSKRVGRNGSTFSTFGESLSFNLQHGFPLLTTKKMFFRGVVEELLFFIRGDTNSKILEEKGINIWKYNTSREFLDGLGKKNRPAGVMGAMYGYQWRFYGAEYDEANARPANRGIDQLKAIVELIKTDPNSRRIILTDYNPAQADSGVLYPCHSLIIQFYVDGRFLDMSCYNRSQDSFLGTPFNIASSALLLTLIAKITNLTPRWLKMSLGDVHIYEQHVDAVKTQTERMPYAFPKLVVPEVRALEDIENCVFDQFILVDYRSHAGIKAEMVA